MKKRWVIAAGAFLVIVLLAVILIPLTLSKTENVYDEMYLTMKSYSNSGDSFLFFSAPPAYDYTLRDLHFSSQLHWIDNSSSRYYGPEDLRETEFLSISYSEKNKSVNFSYRLGLDDGDIFIQFLYNSQSKMLVCNPITISSVESKEKSGPEPTKNAEFVLPFFVENDIEMEDIEAIKNYVLNEKILPDWFEANAGKSKYSMDNLGEFTVVDETYSQLGEDWGR